MRKHYVIQQNNSCVGNLGRDPELRYTPQGDAVCAFSVAVNDRKRDKAGEWQDVTTWFKITLWRNQAENAAKYLSKGRQVSIEGRLGVEEWTDRDGKERYTLAVTATDMQFIGTRADNAGGGESSGGSQRDDHDSGYTGTAPAARSSSAGSSAQVTAPAAADDDIPF